MKLVIHNDSELSAAVATHVAKWKWIPLMSDPLGMWVGPDGMHYQAKQLPFATSADAVLPLLEKERSFNVDRTHFADDGEEYRVSLRSRDAQGMASTFPRAACIALLRAAGHEVTFA